MVSIHTNAAGMTALSALRSASHRLGDAQGMISTGLRVREAADNAAYWSISTTMRSDSRAVSAVQDSLGRAAAIADVAYMALDQTRATLDEIKAKLVLARQPGIDLGKVQQEIGALARHTVTIANSATFAGSNWLVTDIKDIYETEPELRSTYLSSSFNRAGSGAVSVGQIAVDLQKTSLYNEQGGGILQGDPRSPGTVGGIRTRFLTDGLEVMSQGVSNSGFRAPSLPFSFTGPVAFGAADTMTFDVTVDADSPFHGLPGPLHPGKMTAITIDRATVDAVLPGADGVIADYEQMVYILSHALSGSGASVSFVHYSHPDPNAGQRIPDRFVIGTLENSGLFGSSISISGFSSTVGSGGLSDRAMTYGTRGSTVPLTFEPFKVYKDVEVSFAFRTNTDPATSHVIDRDLVDTLLGREDGRVDTADEMAVILEHLIGRPGLLIEPSGGRITVRTDPADDRLAGSRSRILFSGVSVNIEPIPQLALLDIDVAANPALANLYLHTVESMLGRVIDAAATVGAAKSRIEAQSVFNSVLQDAMVRGIGQLVDADMNAASARLQAINAQQQLAIQALAVANAQPQALLQLFGR